ncbi:MAG: hypothetical protein HY506_00360 [Candidatus Yanofskybacteria bacterium]|nr:hypothetical protein [Candidatus Yanofskybacteria bacterium]
MVIGRVNFIFSLLAPIILSLQVFGQSRGEPDDARELWSKIIAQAEQDSAYVGENYTHEELLVTEHLSNGVIKKREEKKYLVEMREDLPYRKLIYEDGLSVSESDFERKEERVAIKRIFFERYNFYLSRQDVLRGEGCLVLSFSAKADWPEEKKEDRVFNNLAGEIWVRKKDLKFMKFKIWLAGKVDFAWPGFMGGKVKKLSAEGSSIFIDGRFALGEIQLEYEYSIRLIFSSHKHSRTAVYYQNYKRREGGT